MKILAALVLSLALLSPADDDEVDPAILKALVARCGSDVDWTSSWDEAARSARESGRPVLVLFRTLAGFDLPDSAMIGPFMDPAIIDLVAERFVALRFQKDMPAPFKSQDSYGMGPFSFGTSVLIATADGEIVGDTFTLESSSLYDFLAEQAARLAPGGSPPGDLEGPDLAEWHLRRGELERAEALLAHAVSARELRLLARLRVQQRRGEDALAALAAARAAGAPAEDVALEEARILMRLDRLEDCEAALARIPDSHPDAGGAMYERAALLLARGDAEGAARVATDLVLTKPEARQAPLAAALLSLGPLLGEAAGRYPAWPDEDVLAALEASPWEKASGTGSAVQSAQAFLLGTQRANGSWVTPGEVMGGAPSAFVDAETRGDEYTNPIAVATTALAARALLPARGEAAMDEAIRRALSFLREARRIEEAEGDPFGVMDYTVWSKPCLLMLLRDALDAGIVEREDWVPAMEGLVRELEAKQKSGGGWSYYKGGDLDHLDPNLDVSFSFVTAYVLHGLRAARDAGIDVPGEMTDAALDCLERMRNPDGSFEYSLFHADEKRPGAPMPAGAAGRGPLCALALLVWGRTNGDEVARALGAFLRHRGSYAHEKGKSVMHCGPEGQGSHYLMFDYAWAAEACLALPEADRAAYRGALLDQVKDARLANGGYLDNPLLGDRYGAAMGIRALRALAD